MTGTPVRDPLADHLITPQNAALLVKNAVSTVKTIKTFEVPVVHSTVNVASGRGQPMLPELADLLNDDKPLDRTTTNSWEDIEFVDIADKWRPYRSLVTSYLFSAAFESAEALPAAWLGSA